MTTVVHPGDSLSGRQRAVYVLVLGALTALGPFTIDLYLPAFPALRSAFDVDAAIIQLTLTGTTIGFAVGQLIMGPWSDKVGRRLPLLLATAVHILASAGAMLATDIGWLMVFRVLQGMGAAAGSVVAMAMVRDLFGGKPLVRMLARLSLVNGLAPILAPLIGAELLKFMDWRGLFVALAGYGIVVIAAVALFIVETLPPERRRDAGSSTVWERYASVFRDRVFIGVALIGSMSFSGLFAYLSASPFLFQETFGFSTSEYSLMFAINSIAVVIGVQTSSRLMRFIGPQWILAGMTIVQLLGGIAIALSAPLGTGAMGAWIPLFIVILATGFGFPAVQVLALSRHGRAAGTAASILGALNFGMAGAISPLVGALGTGSALSMGLVMVGTTVIALLSLWLIVRPRTVPPLAG